ncbi:MAG: hypothetical protein ACPHQA_05725 [Candidatus Puniceispirillaceae bacterium]|jgi:hypothetical protein
MRKNPYKLSANYRQLSPNYHPCHSHGMIWPGWWLAGRWLAGCGEIAEKPTGDGI